MRLRRGRNPRCSRSDPESDTQFVRAAGSARGETPGTYVFGVAAVYLMLLSMTKIGTTRAPDCVHKVIDAHGLGVDAGQLEDMIRNVGIDVSLEEHLLVLDIRTVLGDVRFSAIQVNLRASQTSVELEGHSIERFTHLHHTVCRVAIRIECDV